MINLIWFFIFTRGNIFVILDGDTSKCEIEIPFDILTVIKCGEEDECEGHYLSRLSWAVIVVKDKKFKFF